MKKWACFYVLNTLMEANTRVYDAKQTVHEIAKRMRWATDGCCFRYTIRGFSAVESWRLQIPQFSYAFIKIFSEHCRARMNTSHIWPTMPRASRINKVIAVCYYWTISYIRLFLFFFLFPLSLGQRQYSHLKRTSSTKKWMNETQFADANTRTLPTQRAQGRIATDAS